MIYVSRPRQSEKWLKCWAKSDIVSGIESSWRTVTIRVPQGSILGPILFSFVNLNGGVECILTKCRDDTKMGRVVDIPSKCTAIQRDLVRLE